MIPCAYIFDIDGTLADCSQRLHFILPKEEDLKGDIDLDKIAPDWESFYEACIDDKPIEGVIETLKLLSFTGIKILLVTGRPKKYLAQTLAFICVKMVTTDQIILLNTNCI